MLVKLKWVCHLLSIVEVESVDDVFNLGGLDIILEQSEVLFAEFGATFGRESVLDRVVEALLEFLIDRLGGRLREALTVEILAAHLRNVTLIARDVLALDVLVRATDPVLTLPGGIAILQLIGLGVLSTRVDIVIILIIMRLAHSDIDIVFGRLLLLLRDELVDVARSATINFVLLGHVASVAWQVLLVILRCSY